MITGTYDLIADPSWALLQFQEVRLECDTTLGPVTINLPAISTLATSTNLKLFIIDAEPFGNASVNNIIINAGYTDSGDGLVQDTFDNETTTQLVLNTNGGSVSIQNITKNKWIALESIAGIPTPAEPTYKVYTALVTQSGGDNNRDISQGDNITVGVTYYISINSENADLTFFGAPNNDVGTYFVCTQSGLLPSIGSISLLWNEGAPVVTVLENTIGNIWFTYQTDGTYIIVSDSLFTVNKTITFTTTSSSPNDPYWITMKIVGLQEIYLIQFDGYGSGTNNLPSSTPIEIRVYN